ncbi:clathrin light chain A-like isoform X2 [Littorina saxatilis]|uniref:Clathrin light chain n=1 Tax=Littorina saxatilis TaxID=31220 RepID=A0AAN9ARP1_9CAEN
MADFDAFAAEPEQAAEEDPAAEFLAREQSELAGLEDFESNDAAQSQEGGGGFDSLGEENQGEVGGEEQFGESGTGSGDFNQQQTNGPSDAYSAVSQQDTVRAEPEKIKIWREEQAKQLEQKDQQEDKAKEEWRQKAKKELDDWYKHHAEQLEKTKENNRYSSSSLTAAEEAFIKDRDEKVPGQAWEKITRLCEFNPKNSKNTKDVSRMRSILLQLKQTPLVR